MTQGLPEGPARRAARIVRVGARHGFGFAFGGRFSVRRRAEPDRVGARLRRALSELGPNFAEFGRFLAARRDLLPPDVTAELERTPVEKAPMTPAQVRTRVERELGNALERLFVKFSEEPARVGVFTQAHRAVLPGDRPALVVVSRPGINPDILAMRPVAEVVRRRLGDRLPLDPVAAVAEFGAQAAQRRDMHFTIQTTRRLAEVADLKLRVPKVYRDYSSARCITFEAPDVAVPPDVEGWREVSEALIQLSLERGLFLPDPAPERFASDGATGELWLADPTEFSALDPERVRGIAEVLAAARRGDVSGVVHALPLTGSRTPKDDASLRRELRETLGVFGGPLWQEHSLSRIRDRSMEAARRGSARLQPDLVYLADALVRAEGLGGAEHTGIVAAAEAAERLISRERDPRRVTARTARRLAQPETYADYPRQVHAFLNELKDGEVEVRFRHGGLDDLISKVDILANRLVFALLIAALIIGSSMMGIFVQGGLQVFGLSVFGLAGFVVAAILGLMLLVGIIRSGRL